jgi:hypothetical protein
MSERDAARLSMRTRLEQATAAWLAAGCGESHLLRDWPLVLASCWLLSPGAKHEGFSSDMRAFVDASMKAHRDGFEAILLERDYCDLCGERYRIENLSLCASLTCEGVYCYRCVGTLGRHTNGNWRCPCGDELVG